MFNLKPTENRHSNWPCANTIKADTAVALGEIKAPPETTSSQVPVITHVHMERIVPEWLARGQACMRRLGYIFVKWPIFMHHDVVH